jgi:hypothetical protein
MVRGGIVAFGLLPATTALLTKKRPWNRAFGCRFGTSLMWAISIATQSCKGVVAAHIGIDYCLRPTCFECFHASRFV